MSMTPEERKARKAEADRRRYEANKGKIAEQKRQYGRANKEVISEQKRRYREANIDKVIEKDRQYCKINNEKLKERHRRLRRRKSFIKENGASFQEWLASVCIPSATFEAIANLQPDPGQTLAELIHELSGYAMEVCEQIANPPVAEDDLPAQPTPQPDLF